MRRRSSVATTRRPVVRRGRVVAASTVAALSLAACGGSSDSATVDTVPAVDTQATDADRDTEAPAIDTGPGHVDLVGPDVVATAEIETNQLPSVVLDDVTTGRKVNFRNLVPQDTPILLWMYAPH